MVTLKKLGHSAVHILKAPAKKGLGALAPALATIFGWLGKYGSLTPKQRDEAEKIFGTSVELDKVRITVKSPVLDMLHRAFNIRPFTTMYLINVASQAKIKMPTLIHELTHVWQSSVAGPIYMIEALHALSPLGEGYNYGHHDTPEGHRRGDGAEARLIAADGNFHEFNREQQAMIIQHYYVRRYEEPDSDYTAWQPYADVVHA